MKLGIALGGGGAKGFAHIGILEVLKENGIDCEVVTGTSIGSVVGAAYAAGSLEQLAETSSNIRLTDIPLLLGPTVSLTGLFSGKSVQERLGDIVQYERIEELPKCFAAVSADLATGELVIFSEGSIREAVRASISIPALFTPIRVGSKLLVDGGLVDPIPVEICRTLGATHVLAVDLFGNPQASFNEEDSAARTLWPSGLLNALRYLDTVSAKLNLPPLLGHDKDQDVAIPGNIIEVVEATFSVSQKLLSEARLKEHPADVLLQPAVKDVGLLDFHRGEPIIEIGRECALAALPEIKKLLKG